MMEGWIKLHRELEKWEWYRESYTVHLFIHLLINANHTKQKWQGIDIDRGQLITGLSSLNRSTGISPRSLRTSLERLKSTGEITIKSTNKYSVVTIVKWDFYQNVCQETTSKTTSKTTNERQANDKQTTTNNNVKNIKNEEEEKNLIINNNDEKIFEILNSEIWIQDISRIEGIEISRTQDFLKIFLDDQNLKDEIEHRSIKEIKYHFINWLKKKIEIEKEKSSAKKEKYGKQSKTMDTIDGANYVLKSLGINPFEHLSGSNSD